VGYVAYGREVQLWPGAVRRRGGVELWLGWGFGHTIGSRLGGGAREKGGGGVGGQERAGQTLAEPKKLSVQRRGKGGRKDLEGREARRAEKRGGLSAKKTSRLPGAKKKTDGRKPKDRHPEREDLRRSRRTRASQKGRLLTRPER